MAFYKEGSQEDAQECPVCYECLSGTERTLSCGHVFCHDCLVKTLVSINSINSDGSIRDTIVCPVCRHLTFIRKQKEALVSLAADKAAHEAQTLEVPLPLPQGQLQSARHTSRDTLPRGVNWIARCFRGISERARRQRLISPGHNASQIFIISAEGRPMAEDDALSVVMTVVQPQRRRRRRICTTARCLLILLSAFTILALVAATLPWILLA
ncbi:RING finger protein 222 [Paralichthys olivaceus]|uniref:RING finger protein 222 n=1 Tax=Paralichthys olivaceus TaxID=8255 RepID=UPI0037533101